MRNMSFALTVEQFLNGTKTVTRRLSWGHLKPGDRVMGVRKAMGLKKGEKIERLGEIEIISNTHEPLRRLIDEPEYGRQEVVKEGFPHFSPANFVTFFSGANLCQSNTIVNRIEFRKL